MLNSPPCKYFLGNGKAKLRFVVLLLAATAIIQLQTNNLFALVRFLLSEDRQFGFSLGCWINENDGEIVIRYRPRIQIQETLTNSPSRSYQIVVNSEVIGELRFIQSDGHYRNGNRTSNTFTAAEHSINDFPIQEIIAGLGNAETFIMRRVGTPQEHVFSSSAINQPYQLCSDEKSSREWAEIRQNLIIAAVLIVVVLIAFLIIRNRKQVETQIQDRQQRELEEQEARRREEKARLAAEEEQRQLLAEQERLDREAKAEKAAAFRTIALRKRDIFARTLQADLWPADDPRVAELQKDRDDLAEAEASIVERYALPPPSEPSPEQNPPASPPAA